MSEDEQELCDFVRKQYQYEAELLDKGDLSFAAMVRKNADAFLMYFMGLETPEQIKGAAQMLRDEEARSAARKGVSDE